MTLIPIDESGQAYAYRCDICYMMAASEPDLAGHLAWHALFFDQRPLTSPEAGKDLEGLRQEFVKFIAEGPR